MPLCWCELRRAWCVQAGPRRSAIWRELLQRRQPCCGHACSRMSKGCEMTLACKQRHRPLQAPAFDENTVPQCCLFGEATGPDGDTARVRSASALRRASCPSACWSSQQTCAVHHEHIALLCNALGKATRRRAEKRLRADAPAGCRGAHDRVCPPVAVQVAEWLPLAWPWA